jgi:hypothetical protein
VADEQQTPIGLQTGQLGEGLVRVKAAGQRRVDRQSPTLLLTPVLSGQLRGLTRACPGAEQDGVKARLQPCQRDPGRMRLAFTTRREAAGGVGAGTVGLGVSVT